MILDGYNSFNFTEKHAGPFKNVLEYLGVTMPSTGEPFTEAMLFGIGGGIGAEYITWSMKSKEDAGFYLRLWYKPLKVTSIADYFIPRVASRLGIPLTVNLTTSRKKGDQTLSDVLQENKPVILYLSSRSIKTNSPLPYSAFSMGTSLAPSYCPVVSSFDEGTGNLILADRSLQPITTSIGELAEARAVMKHAIIAVDRPAELKDLGKAIRSGIRDCCHEILNNRMRNCRVEAFQVWANRLANAKDKQGWLQFSHEKLMGNLTTVHSRIKYFLSSEGALRSTFADFLEDAGSILKNPKLKNVSLIYRDLAVQWGEFAESLLPDSGPQFRDLRLALKQQNSIYLKKGLSDSEFMSVSQRVEMIHKQIINSWPFTEKETQSFFEDLSELLESIYQSEKETIHTLKSVIS